MKRGGVSAPIRLFIFDNRIEIVSPGHLPNNLTVAKIRTGNSNIRNLILVSYIAKGLLPYRGLGSGINQALEDWPEIDFTDDRDGCLFIATVRRKPMTGSAEPEAGSPKGSGKGSGKTGSRILEMLQKTPGMTIPDLAEALTISTRAVEKQIMRLRNEGRLRRIGPAKDGHWEVL